MPPHWANAHEGLAVHPRVGEATPPHSFKPFPHRQVSPFPTSWDQVATFYLRLGIRSPQQLHTSIISTCGLWI